jgi:hypothetical protein
MTKTTKKLKQRVADLERALDRMLQINPVCLLSRIGQKDCDRTFHCEDVCYVCHGRRVLEDQRGYDYWG